MTSLFEELYARRPILNYVCPPVCEVLFSGSGFPAIVLGDFSSLISPGGVRFGGFGGFRLSWNNYPGAICYNVYRSDTADPDSPLVLVFECVTDTEIPLPPGCYRVSAITPDGETALSEVVCYFVPPMLPPEVTTHPASDITTTQAVLNGVINAIGQASTAQFEWGTTIAYGNFTPLQNTGDTFADVPFNALITGLTPNSLYHFRAIGSNSSGVGQGEDLMVLTTASGGGFVVIGEYWTFDATLVGAVQGVTLASGGNVSFTSGIVNSAIRMLSPTTAFVFAPDDNRLAYQGNGMTLATWFNIASTTPDAVLAILQHTWLSPTSTDQVSIQLLYSSTTNTFELSFNRYDTLQVQTVSLIHSFGGGWLFVVVWYDPADGFIRIQIDNSTIYTGTGGPIFLPGYPTGTGVFQQNAQPVGGSFDVLYDESLLHEDVLNSDERDFLWNGGAGRTYPFV